MKLLVKERKRDFKKPKDILVELLKQFPRAKETRIGKELILELLEKELWK